MFNLRRIRQVFRHGWRHAGEISTKHFSGRKRIHIFIDILSCFYEYGMWSNQYLAEKMWTLSPSERKATGQDIQLSNTKKEFWLNDFYENRDFIIKYGNIKYEKASFRDKRNRVYTERYNAGQNLQVEYDVNISRQHYLDGTISIGDNVLLAKHVFIDYSGSVVIKNDVQLTNGVIIETHHHAFHSDPSVSRDIVVPSELIIEEGVVIGSRAIILSTCHYIGRYSRIGVGAVVTKDIPDFSVAVGIPAKVVRTIDSPGNRESF